MARKKTATRKVSGADGRSVDGNGPELVELLLRSGQPELDEIGQAVAVIDGQIEELKKKRSSLSSARNMIQLRMRGCPSTKSQQEARRVAIHDFLQKHGKGTMTEIASGTSIPLGSLCKLLKHEWFIRGAQGWKNATSSSRSERTLPAGN